MDTKDRIMETAFKLFLKKGFVDVSLSEIMTESNITTGGFYYHFDSKDTLLIEVINKYILDYHFDATIEQIRNLEGTPKEKFKRVMLSIVLGGSNNKMTEILEKSEKIDFRVLHLLVLEGVQKFDIIAEHYTEFFYNLLDFINDIINDGVDQGLIRADLDPSRLAALIQSVMIGTSMMWIGMPEMPLEKTMESNIDQLWTYIEKM